MNNNHILEEIETYLWNNLTRTQRTVKAEDGTWVTLVEINVYWEDEEHGTVGIELIYDPVLEVKIDA